MTDFNSAQKELTKDDAFNAIVEGMKILGWDKKECVHTQLHEAQDVKVNFGVLEQHTDAMKQQSELIEQWVEKEEKKKTSTISTYLSF